MDIEFDPVKNNRNLEVRGISFESAAEFDFRSALILLDDRKDYGEIRYRAMGLGRHYAQTKA